MSKYYRSPKCIQSPCGVCSLVVSSPPAENRVLESWDQIPAGYQNEEYQIVVHSLISLDVFSQMAKFHPIWSDSRNHNTIKAQSVRTD
jgi:hypothetical protein